MHFIKHIFTFGLSLFRNQFSTSKYFYKGYVWWIIPTIHMLTMWESSQDHGFSCFPWESANNSSLWKLIYNCFPWKLIYNSAIWGSVYNCLFLLKKALHFLHFLTITRREWRENVYLVDERRKGWHGNSFHTPFFTQCSKIQKKYFWGGQPTLFIWMMILLGPTHT